MEGHHSFARHKQQCAKTIKQKARQHTSLVPPAADYHSRGDGHDEIPPVEHQLDIGGIGLGDMQQILEMLIENIKDAMRKAPAEEEGGYKNKGKQVLPAYDL